MNEPKRESQFDPFASQIQDSLEGYTQEMINSCVGGGRKGSKLKIEREVSCEIEIEGKRKQLEIIYDLTSEECKEMSMESSFWKGGAQRKKKKRDEFKENSKKRKGIKRKKDDGLLQTTLSQWVHPR